MSFFTFPKDSNRLAKRRAIKSSNVSIIKRVRPQSCDLTLPFTQDLDAIERKKLTDNGVLK